MAKKTTIKMFALTVADTTNHSHVKVLNSICKAFHMFKRDSIGLWEIDDEEIVLNAQAQCVDMGIPLAETRIWDRVAEPFRKKEVGTIQAGSIVRHEDVMLELKTHFENDVWLENREDGSTVELEKDTIVELIEENIVIGINDKKSA